MAASARPPDPVAMLGRRGVTDPDVRRAICEIPRTPFVAEACAAAAWDDHPLPDGAGGTALSPGALAVLLQALSPAAHGRALVVGAGGGYPAAVLAQLAREVDVVDHDLDVARATLQRLRAVGLASVRVHRAEHEAAGWPERAPYDHILVTGVVTQVPADLREQLAVGGALVAMLGPDRVRPRVIRVARVDETRFEELEVGTIELATRIGDVLVAMRLAERDRVEALVPAAREAGRRLGEVLIAEGVVAEEDLHRALAAQRGLAFGQVEALLQNASMTIARGVPRTFLERHHVLPLRRENGRVVVATSDPDAAVADLGKALGAPLDIHLVTPTDYRRLWAALDLRTHAPPPPASSESAAVAAQDDLLGRTDVDAHRVALFETLLLEAVGERASDIHLERYGDRVRVRLRVDGELRDVTRVPMTVDDLVGVVNVVKVSAGLDIAERRIPQGGRIRRRAGDHAFDLRVQTQPALYGEHVVIRLLPQDVRMLTIEDLGFAPDVASAYRRLLDSPAGLILVVGPTGSGKSTTLYAGLQILARDASRKVLTIEDPIEYSIEQVQQSQAKPEIGFSFANAMRAFVREDPDVILVGEIRDAETALEAIRASQTGHVVLSTLHCNDAPDAVQRLLDLGMHPNSIASELVAVFAQRLAKRICSGCRRPAEPEPEILAELFPQGVPEGFVCFRGVGCDRCQGHGTHGRVAVVEYLRTGPDVRRAISRRVPLDELRDVSLSAGLVPMRDAALELVARGLIPLSELPSVLPAERMAPERTLPPR